MRLILPIVFVIFIFLQKKVKKINFYKISLVFYFIFLSLRFMQGTDYIHYLTCYNIERPLYEVISNGFINTQFELLYNISVSIFRMFSIPFPIFIGVINLINLLLINNFLKNFSNNKLISLLLLYLLYGIVFFESAIRQSIALSCFLGLGLVAFKKHDFKTIIISCVISFFFHRSSLIISLILILLFIIYEKYSVKQLRKIIVMNNKKIILIFLIAFILINIIPFEIIFSYLPSVLSQKLIYYFSNYSISWMSIILRLIYLIFFIYIIYEEKKSILYRKNFLYLLYLCGFILYFLFIKFSILSRITVYFEILEIVIFLDLFKNIRNKLSIKNILIVLYCFISILLFFKDGIETQKQSNYKEISIICPYYTYFDENEAIQKMNIIN